MTPAKRRFRLALLVLVDRDIYPGPVQIRRVLGRDDRIRSIDGRETEWRREFLRSIGWTERRRPHTRRHSWIVP